jgi:hypothetical protein
MTTLAESASSLQHFIPKSAICVAAWDLVIAADLPLTIVHHSLRVHLFAKWLAQKEKSELANSDLLFVACICHDIGASHTHDGPQRFEVEGADAAANMLRDQGLSEGDAHQVWTAIALHTSAQIAERIDPLTRLVRLAVLMDFIPGTRTKLGADEYGKDLEDKIPRFDIEKILGDAVVDQAVKNPGKAPPASWPGILYKSHMENPEWTGVNQAF